MLKNISIALATWCFLVCSMAINANETTAFQSVSTEESIITVRGNHIHCFGDSTGSIDVKIHTDPHHYIITLYDKTPATRQKYIAEQAIHGNSCLFADLLAGHYYILVRDSLNQRFIKELTLKQPPKLQYEGFEIIQNPTDDYKADGSINISISGGTPPYTIFWDPPLTGSSQKADNIPFGNYSCTITDSKNCPAIKPTIFFYPDKTQNNE